MTVAHLLDTCTISQYLAPDAAKKTPGLVRRVDEVIATDGARISIVTLYELDRGLKKLELRGEGKRKRRLGQRRADEGRDHAATLQLLGAGHGHAESRRDAAED